jgi:hypothetical protein
VSIARWLRVHRADWRFGLRITVAGVLAFALAHAFDLPQGYWAVFTAVLVTQASVGGSLKAAIDRLIGTFAGAVAGAAAAALVPPGDVVALGVALAVALIPMAVLSAIYPMLRVAPVTVVILLLGSAGSQEGPFLAAILRTLEVGLGGIVGLLVSVFVFPARAHAVMCESAANLLDMLATLLADLFAALQAPTDAAAISRRHEAIQSAFDRMELAAQEADRERRTLLVAEADPDPIPRTLRRVYHDLVLVGRVASTPLWRPGDAPAVVFAGFAPEAVSYLRALGQSLRARKTPPPSGKLDAAFLRCELALGEGRAAKDGNDRLVALAFALEQLQRNMRDLAARARESARSNRQAAAPPEILNPPLL